MKTLINGTKDYVIHQSSTVIMQTGDNWREPQWVDEKNGIVTFKNKATRIIFYEDEIADGYPTGNAKRVELDCSDILKLAERIKEINNSTFEDIYEPDY